MKIQIMGYSGSGKSTLAVKLAKLYDIPCLHLDNVQYFGDWQSRSVDEQTMMIRDFMTTNDSWIIDGNYLNIATERFLNSDITIFLSFNRFYCYWKCLRRYHSNKGKSRESCPCIEKFDSEFRRWVFFTGGTLKRKQRLINRFNQTKGKKLIFKNVRQLNEWINKVSIND
jgi:adenylate kinase family enzyme